MTDEQADAEELWEQSSGDERHTSDPTTPAEDGESAPELPNALRDAYRDVLGGEVSSNSTVRDKNVTALLLGLEASGELAGVIEDANRVLDRDTDGESRSSALGALVRVGLGEVRPELMDEALEARNDVEREDSF